MSFLFIRIYAIFEGRPFAIRRSGIFRTYARDCVWFDTECNEYANAISCCFCLFGFLSNCFRHVRRSNAKSSNYAILIIIRCQGIRFFLRSLFCFRTFEDFSIFRVSASRDEDGNFCHFSGFVQIFFVCFGVRCIGSNVGFGRRSLSFRCKFSTRNACVSWAWCDYSIESCNCRIAFINVIMYNVQVLLSFRAQFYCSQ